jgi:hypothetical protein
MRPLKEKQMSKLMVLFFAVALVAMAGCAYWVNNRVYDEQRINSDKESHSSGVNAGIPKENRGNR